MEQPRTQRNRVVVVSQPGVLREALVAVLASYATTTITGRASGALTALNLVRQQPPHLLVIDNTLPEDEAIALVRQVKQECPAVACLVFSSAYRPQPQWHDAGADELLPRYSSGEELDQALRRLTHSTAV